MGGNETALTRRSDAGPATCRMKIGTLAQHTQRAQFSGHGSAADPRVSSTQLSGTTLASRSVL